MHYNISLKKTVLNIRGMNLVKSKHWPDTVPQLLFYKVFSLFSALTIDPRQHKTFLHPQYNIRSSCSTKTNSAGGYQNPPSSLHSRKNICAGSKAEFGSQQRNCHEKHMNLNKTFLAFF